MWSSCISIHLEYNNLCFWADEEESDAFFRVTLPFAVAGLFLATGCRFSDVVLPVRTTPVRPMACGEQGSSWSKYNKKMNNCQSQTKIKLHQLIRKILDRYLYSSLESLQRKKTHMQQITPNKKNKTYSFKMGHNKITKENCLLKSRSTKTLRLCKNRKQKQSVT